MRRKAPSLLWRAIAAAVLTIVFYGLAILIAGGLLALPVLEVVYGGRLHIKLAIIGVIGAFAIVAAIWPRFDKFDAPGVRLRPDEHPQLFGAIERVAARAGQECPKEVYLVPNVNAFVSERGGLLGFGSRRVMGIGLPLMQTLNVSEFLGVVAHEFGHFHGGDTKLGRWVFKTQAAIIRTLANLGNSVLSLPFIWYGNLFLRITSSISRQQEFAADTFAAEIAGKKAFASGLRKVHGMGMAYDAFWQNEMVPVLSSGFLPDGTAGFQMFVSQPLVAQQIESALEAQQREVKTGTYDTHPSLADRMAAIAELPDVATPNLSDPALSLLNRVEANENALLRVQFGTERIVELKSLDWKDVGREVYLPFWRKAVEAIASVLGDACVQNMPQLIASEELARAIHNNLQKFQSAEERGRAVASALGALLACRLAELGWTISAPPGGDVELHKDDLSITPFKEAQAWLTDRVAVAAWPERCRQLGLAGSPLVETAT